MNAIHRPLAETVGELDELFAGARLVVESRISSPVEIDATAGGVFTNQVTQTTSREPTTNQRNRFISHMVKIRYARS